MQPDTFEITEKDWFISLPQFASHVLRVLNLDRTREII